MVISLFLANDYTNREIESSDAVFLVASILAMMVITIAAEVHTTATLWIWNRAQNSGTR